MARRPWTAHELLDLVLDAGSFESLLVRNIMAPTAPGSNHNSTPSLRIRIVHSRSCARRRGIRSPRLETRSVGSSWRSSVHLPDPVGPSTKRL